MEIEWVVTKTRAKDSHALTRQIRVGRKIGGARLRKGKALWVSVLGGRAGTETKRGGAAAGLFSRQ